MANTDLTDDMLVVIDGYDMCYTTSNSGRVICKISKQVAHPDFLLKNGEILIECRKGGFAAQHPNRLRHLTVRDVQSNVSKCDYSTQQAVLSMCMPK